MEAGLVFFWDAFWELSTERQMGFGALGPIPHRSIREFARDHEIVDTDEFRVFRLIMRGMDAEFRGTRVRPSEPHVIEEVSVRNFAGLKGLLSRLGKTEEPPLTT